MIHRVTLYYMGNCRAPHRQIGGRRWMMIALWIRWRREGPFDSFLLWQPRNNFIQKISYKSQKWLSFSKWIWNALVWGPSINNVWNFFGLVDLHVSVVIVILNSFIICFSLPSPWSCVDVIYRWALAISRPCSEHSCRTNTSNAISFAWNVSIRIQPLTPNVSNQLHFKFCYSSWNGGDSVFLPYPPLHRLLFHFSGHGPPPPFLPFWTFQSFERWWWWWLFVTVLG